jgi:hypothetical protein
MRRLHDHRCLKQSRAGISREPARQGEPVSCGNWCKRDGQILDGLQHVNEKTNTETEFSKNRIMSLA